MFQLEICGYPDLADTIHRFQPSHVVSAIENIERLDHCQHLHVSVSDISSPMDGHILPGSDHLQKVLSFTRALTEGDRLLVHCFAGQSRSTAYAIAILIQHGATVEDAFNAVSVIRPILLPNRMIIRLVDNHFDLGGKLETLVANFYSGTFQRTQRPPSAPSENAIAQMKYLNDLLKDLVNEPLDSD